MRQRSHLRRSRRRRARPSLKLRELLLGSLNDLFWKPCELRDVDAKRLVARAIYNAVKHGQLCARAVKARLHVAIFYAAGARDSGELVEVRRKERRRANDLQETSAVHFLVGCNVAAMAR